jgi:2-aminoethylphosphonate-pyruvate transaminase
MKDDVLVEIRRRFEERGASQYGGERVTQLEHALQTAMLAEADGADAQLVTAALLHDFGHLLHDLPEDAPDNGVDDAHEHRAYGWLSEHFGEEVTEPIRLHVAAKRYLCAVEPSYRASLSAPSLKSLQLQGGVFSGKEVREFQEQPFSDEGARLRRWDDLAKVSGLMTPSLEHFLAYAAETRRTASTEAICDTNRESGDSFIVQPMSCESMQSNNQQSPSRSKPLFTPGPLTTSPTVKSAMLRDLGSRDTEFIEVVRRIRHRLLEVAGVSQQSGYECVLMQGSGTYMLESVITSAMQPQSKLLVVVNGAYGDRIVSIAQRHGIEAVVVRTSENKLPDVNEINKVLSTHPSIAMVAVVHCETTSGIMNPIQAIGEAVHRHGCQYFVDSMSAFGAVPVDMKACHIDFLVSSANKCIEGVPGFAFVICGRSALLATEGLSRTVSLDLYAQWKGLEQNGQFRFTPPTHALVAFDQALRELESEGGVEGRARRYRENHETLSRGMKELGFAEYVPHASQGDIITSFPYPAHPHFAFEEFYQRLNEKGFVIYPGKVSDADCFRIGTIGRIFPSDVLALLGAIRDVLSEMNIQVPLQ